MKFIYLVIGILFFSCSNNQNNDSENSEKIPETFSDKNNSEKPVIQRELSKAENQRKEDQKNSLDSVKLVINEWNRGINESDFELLNTLYFDQVQFYLSSTSKAKLIESKKKSLNKNKGYKQTINILEVQYPAQDEESIRCVFEKKYFDGKKNQKVSAIIDLKYKDSAYLIYKESDLPTEMSRINSEKSIKLDKKIFVFAHDYWLDTRDDKVLAHDFVPYYTEVTVNNVNELSVEMFSYSGSLRQVTSFKTKDVSSSNGFLTFKAAPNLFGTDDAETEYSEEDFQFFKFKILKSNLALVATDGWLESLAGTHFWEIVKE